MKENFVHGMHFIKTIFQRPVDLIEKAISFPFMLGSLSEKEEQVIKKFKQELLHRYPDKVIDILVYGSKARGDYHGESDIDVLVIAKESAGRLPIK